MGTGFGSTRRIALAGVLAALLIGSCWSEPQVPQSLESSTEPLREGEAPFELGPNDSVRWLDDGRLFVETGRGSVPYQHVTQLWIAFEQDRAARVEIRAWSEELASNARWPQRNFEGSAWASSDGTDLGGVDGPDLVVDLKYRAWQSGSDVTGGQRLLLRSQQLLR